LSLSSLLKECPNTHFGNYIAIIRFFLGKLLHRPILKLRHNSESIFVLGQSFNKENSDKRFLVHLLVEIINYTKMHGEYKVKLKMGSEVVGNLRLFLRNKKKSFSCAYGV
jgi:hypothetical protein